MRFAQWGTHARQPQLVVGVGLCSQARGGWPASPLEFAQPRRHQGNTGVASCLLRHKIFGRDYELLKQSGLLREPEAQPQKDGGQPFAEGGKDSQDMGRSARAEVLAEGGVCWTPPGGRRRTWAAFHTILSKTTEHS